jgi:hypothetical protein
MLVPAALVLIMGLAINSPFTTGSIGWGLDHSRYAIEGMQYSAALRQAIFEVASNAVSAVGGGFVWSGLASTAIALGLIVWGVMTRSEPHPAPAIASTPAADVNKTS